MAKDVKSKPKPVAGSKPSAPRKRRTKSSVKHVLGKPEVIEDAAFDEAKGLILKIGKDFDIVLQRAIANLARKHNVTEAMAYTAISYRLMTSAVENAMSVVLMEKDIADNDD